MSRLGFIAWQGKSWIDGSPIMAVVTLKTSNRKTGDMAQVWILRTDLDPVAAIKSGGDRSICGGCIHRGTDGFAGRSCYVDVGKAPLVIWRAVQRGAYARFDSSGSQEVQAARIASALDRRAVRLGAYGDPAVLPEWVLQSLTLKAHRHTGYTHQWRDPRAAQARRFCMASCDTPAEVDAARADGWRVFFVGATKIVGHRSIACPASDEAGHRTTCDRCGLCSGANTTSGRPIAFSRSVPSVVTILPHGSGTKHLAAKVALTIGGAPIGGAPRA